MLLKKPCHNKYLCCSCLKSGKGGTWTCGKEGHVIMGVSYKIHFPSPKAKRKKWLETVKLFSHNPWFTDRQEWPVLLRTIYNKK